MKTKNIDLHKPKADLWFASGNRLQYDYQNGEIFDQKDDYNRETSVRIWNKVVHGVEKSEPNWLTMMPGFPDGSFGWAATEQHLVHQETTSRIYVEYVGMGDSDKPEGYEYSVKERADMVEALWKFHGVKTTQLITFDFSSIVALELLSRQIEAENSGKNNGTIITKVLTINGGLFADSHTHPILTTPLLKTSFGRLGAKFAQNSTFAFNMMMKDLWSKEYGVTKEELAQNHNAIGRRDGTMFMSNAAGFVDEHKLNAERWDLKRIFTATYPQVKYIVAGSKKDQFEYKQVKKAQKELAPLGLEIVSYPGGHMTTSEHPNLIAGTIEKMNRMDH